MKMNVKKYVYKILGFIALFILYGTLEPMNCFDLSRTAAQSGICIAFIGLAAIGFKTIDKRNMKGGAEMERCENCAYSEDYGESFLFIRCERTKSNMIVKKDFWCKYYLDKTESIIKNIDEIYENELLTGELYDDA